MTFISDGVAVVTGAGSGIGRALSQQLCAAGSVLAIADIDEKGLAETAASLTAKQAALSTHVLDVSNEAAVKAFENKEFDTVDIIYSQFKNAATQSFVVEKFLPIPKVEKKAGAANNDFIYEPGKEELITELMPKILNTQLFKAVLDANASEHGARMTAMDKASDNANELLKSLRLSYNRARQAAITTELTEIVSGAAALQG